MPLPTVSAIWTTPIKGLALHRRDAIDLGPAGATENRAFFLVDADGRLINGKRVETLSTVRAEWDRDADRLALTFPDGAQVDAPLAPGPPFVARFFSEELSVEPVAPELGEALSAFAGTSLRIVRVDPARSANDRGPEGSVSLMSTASLDHLAALADEAVDARRFRMLLEVDGVDAHGEDAWVGRTVAIGTARVRFGGHVGRCRVTTLDPDTGAVTLPVLELLAYRKGLDTTEPLAFGIYGEVVGPGRVAVGDPVVPEP